MDHLEKKNITTLFIHKLELWWNILSADLKITG